MMYVRLWYSPIVHFSGHTTAGFVRYKGYIAMHMPMHEYTDVYLSLHAWQIVVQYKHDCR